MQTTTTYKAPDIECDGCANAIKKSVGAVPGVTAVAVSVPEKTVTVTHDEQAAPKTTLEQALDRAGFPVTPAA